MFRLNDACIKKSRILSCQRSAWLGITIEYFTSGSIPNVEILNVEFQTVELRNAAYEKIKHAANENDVEVLEVQYF